MCVCARVCVTRAHTSSCVCERSLTPGLPAASAKKAKEQPHPDEPAANSKGFGAPVQRVRDQLQRERSRAEPPRDGKTEGMTWRERDVRASIILWPKCGSDGSCFRLVPGGDVVDCGQGCLKDDRSCWHRGDRAGAEQTPFRTSCASPVQPSSLNDDDDGDDEEGEQSGGEGGAEIETEGSPHGDDAHTHTHTDAPRAQAQGQQESAAAHHGSRRRSLSTPGQGQARVLPPCRGGLGHVPGARHGTWGGVGGVLGQRWETWGAGVGCMECMGCSREASASLSHPSPSSTMIMRLTPVYMIMRD